MAITKIITIRDRLDKRVNYVVNSEKTSLDASVLYAVNPEKTEQSFFTAVLNCESVQTAYAEMTDTKKRWNKTGGVLGYHFIQSFAPGEVTPEQAHRIGVEFARELFGDRYEVVIGTHLDKAHLHNHIIVNSVSFRDGSKYHSSPGSYFFQVRKTSDDLCRENELSVVEPKGRGRSYGEWKADQQGKPTIRGIIRGDIDALIAQAYTYQSLLMLLERQGYTVKHGPNRKYTTVQPPGAKRAIRLDSLGEGYTEEAIKQRLAAQRSGEKNISSVYGSAASQGRTGIVNAMKAALAANTEASGTYPTAPDGHVQLTWTQVQYYLLEQVLATDEEASAQAAAKGFDWQERDITGAPQTVTLDEVLAAAYVPALDGSSATLDALCTAEVLQGLRLRRKADRVTSVNQYDLDGSMVRMGWAALESLVYWDLGTQDLVIAGDTPFAGDIMVMS